MKANKKLLAALLILVVVVSFSACGNSKETKETKVETNADTTEKPAEESKPTEVEKEEPEEKPVEDKKEEAEETEETENEEDKWLEAFTEAYEGQNEEGDFVYYAGGDIGDEGLLMFVDKEETEHYVFVGPVVKNEDGGLTITDEEDGLALDFSVTEGETEEEIVIDMGEELGTAVLHDASVKDVIEKMIQINNTTESASLDPEDLLETFTEAYAGVTEDDGKMLYAGTSEGEVALLMFIDKEVTEHILFVGPVVKNEDDTLTITNEEDGSSLTFSVTILEEGIELDMGEEIGKAVLQDVPVKDVIDAMIEVEETTENVRED